MNGPIDATVAEKPLQNQRGLHTYRLFKRTLNSGITKKCTRVAKSGVLTMENLSSRPGDFGRSSLQDVANTHIVIPIEATSTGQAVH